MVTIPLSAGGIELTTLLSNSLETGRHRKSAIGGETIETGYNFLFRFPSNGKAHLNFDDMSLFGGFGVFPFPSSGKA